mgnify:CR=1 FL=1
MAELKTTTAPVSTQPPVVDRAQDFWTRYQKPIMALGIGFILGVGAFLAYKYLYQAPQEQKAVDQLAKAEEYFRADSLNLALNGDGINPGFLKIADKFENTKAGNLAHFYAGAVLLQQGNAAKAADMLDDFETDAPQIQARAYKLLGDAYAEQGKNSDALDEYKKAAHHFEQDEVASSEYLFMAAYFADRVAKKREEAVELFKELKEKYPRTERGFEADKYLAQLGVYN